MGVIRTAIVNPDTGRPEYGPMNAAYNRAGRIAKVTDESGMEERFYGKLGETTREVKSVDAKTPASSRKVYTTDYVFDSFGRMFQMTYPDGESPNTNAPGFPPVKGLWRLCSASGTTLYNQPPLCYHTPVYENQTSRNHRLQVVHR